MHVWGRLFEYLWPNMRLYTKGKMSNFNIFKYFGWEQPQRGKVSIYFMPL